MLNLLHVALDYSAMGLSPVALQLGPFALRWYSLAYIAGILLGWWYLGKMIDAGDAPLSRPQLDEFITWATLGVIIGGRLGYVLFYDLAKFAADPVSIFKLWEGGMSFHGGAFGVLVAVVVYARMHQLRWLRILDYVSCVTPLGLMFGRLANFVNGELWGRPTGTSWGVIFPDAGPEPRYPSQLFEAGLEGAVLLLVLGWLFWLTPARRYPGLMSGVFILGYGIFRFIVENFREPDRQLGILSTGLTMGQSLCIPMIVAGLWLIATSRGRIAAPAQ
jgi:phosphatidylglycerol---prolipoprotein diacylglyceryl transferase